MFNYSNDQCIHIFYFIKNTADNTKDFLGLFSAEGAPEVISDPDESISSNQQPKRKLGVYNNLNDK